MSVLFCDLVGFTSASEAADPEDVQARLATYHAMLRSQGERYGGTVEKFIGDAVMAVFGAPTTHEDDAERAVRAGLRIVEATGELTEQQPGLDLRVRVGINTGEALVNLSARPERGEGFVTGDVVNTASRLQGAAPVGGVAVGEQTFVATKELFDYAELPPAELKGKAEPVRLFHAVGARSRFGTDLTRRHTTPLVGREIDLALLKGAFDKAVSGPSLQLVTVVGEPGVGKSRLVTELFTHIDALPELVRFRQGRCLPYGEGITFWAVGEIVKAETGVLDSDDPDTARAKLVQSIDWLIEDPAERGWFVEQLAPLLGVATPSGSREETFTAWRRFLEAAAGENPTVCVIEDLHWADQALLDFIEHLAEWTHSVPLLVVCTARPELYEQQPTWGAGLRKRVDLSLDPLSDTESAKLVSALLGRAVLPAETQSLLVERCGGNPLYAEEFIQMLADRGLLDDAGRLTVDTAQLSFPSSVQAIIAARLDTLPAERKTALQDAAVIGKVFWAGAVTALSNRPPEGVAADLHELAKKELIRPARASTVAGEAEHSFWHAFIRDVAYNGIPRAIRASKHHAAASWIEQTAGERVEEYAEILAHHYLTAAQLAAATAADDLEVGELRNQARRHLLTAARRTTELDVPRAERLARSALDITPRNHQDRPEADFQLAHVLLVADRLDEARALFEAAIAGFERRGDDTGHAHSVIGLARVVDKHDPAQADQMIADAIDTLEQLPPGPELIIALTTAAARAMMASRDANAVALADQILQLLDQGVPGQGPADLARAHAMHFRGMGRFGLGDLGGLDDVRASITLNPNQAFFHSNLATLLAATEGATPALEEVEQGIKLATAQGAQRDALRMRVERLDRLFTTGRWDELLEHTPPLIQRLAGNLDEYWQAIAEARLARTLSLRGGGDLGTLLADCQDRARRIADPQVLLPALVVAASAAASHGDRTELTRLLEEIESTFIPISEDQRLWEVPELTRLAAGNQDLRLADRCIANVPPTYPASRASLASAQGTVHEATGDLEQAISHYRDAAQRWVRLGHVVEHAYALLGLGRSRLTAGDAAGAGDVLTARTIFTNLRAQPLIAAADRLLSEQQRLTS